MHSVERLYRLTNSQSKTSSYKYKLQCQDKITNEKTTTDDWLRFNHDSQDIKIFEALLEKKKHVVVKVGLSKILFGFNLSSLKLPTFLSFDCHFKCMDSFDKISTGSRICGNEISVLVMPFISGGQIDKFKWTRENVDVYKSVLKHVICSLLYAYETLSFVHNDMHFGNILLKKTKKSSIQYGDWSIPVVKGYIPDARKSKKSIITTIKTTWIKIWLFLKKFKGCAPSPYLSNKIPRYGSFP